MKNKSNFEYGFLFVLFAVIMKIIYKINLVEYFKYIAIKIMKINKNDEQYIQIKNVAIDVFIISKWIFIFLIWFFNVKNYLCTTIVIYLIITNLFTYFYYHVWDSDALDLDNFKIDRIRNRFKNLLQAFGFSIYSFAYLFQMPFSNHFNWTNNISTFSKSVLYSAANSLTVGYGGITPNDTFGNLFSISEVVISFIFIAIIFSRSIPQTKSKN